MKDDLRVAITKKMLSEGLLALLKDKDISKINVSELCMSAGVNRATFYRHYQQPRDIIVEIRHNMFNDIKLLVEKRGNVVDIGECIEDMCRYFYERAELFNILLKCRTDDEFVSFINEVYKNHFAMMRSAGYGAGLDDDALRLNTYFVSGGIYYVLRQWISEPIDKTPAEIAKIIRRFLNA